jgi:hypothetical protein
VTVDELPAVLGIFRDRAAAAAGPAAKAMADTYKSHLTKVTLQRFHSAPGQFGTTSPEGSPIAFRTGHLASTVTSTAGRSGAGFGSAYVRPNTIYAVTQEWGDEHTPSRFKYMRWHNSGGWWRKELVKIPERSYMRPAVRETVADGSLTRSAALMFRSLVGPY